MEKKRRVYGGRFVYLIVPRSIPFGVSRTRNDRKNARSENKIIIVKRRNSTQIESIFAEKCLPLRLKIACDS